MLFRNEARRLRWGLPGPSHGRSSVRRWAARLMVRSAIKFSAAPGAAGVGIPCGEVTLGGRTTRYETCGVNTCRGAFRPARKREQALSCDLC